LNTESTVDSVDLGESWNGPSSCENPKCVTVQGVLNFSFFWWLNDHIRRLSV